MKRPRPRLETGADVENGGEDAAGSEGGSNARRAGAGREGGGEKGSMDGTRSPQPKVERGARSTFGGLGPDSQQIRGLWPNARGPVPRPFSPPPFGIVRDRRATTGNLLPATDSPRPRTTSDVVAAPREILGARTIGIGSKPDAWNHGTVLNERALVSPVSRSNADAPWSSIDLPRAMSEYEGPSRLGTRTAPTRRNAVESRGARSPIPFAVIHCSA